MLRSDTACLRPPHPADLDVLAALRNDVASQLDLMALPRPSTRARVQDWIERRCNDPAGLFYVIATVPDDRAAGFVQLTRMDLLHGTANLGIAIHEDFRGRGLATEALRLLEVHSRDVFRLRKMLLSVLADNARAINVYERAGYRRVGVHRAQHYQHGAYRDVLLMERFLDQPRP